MYFKLIVQSSSFDWGQFLKSPVSDWFMRMMKSARSRCIDVSFVVVAGGLCICVRDEVVNGKVASSSLMRSSLAVGVWK